MIRPATLCLMFVAANLGSCSGDDSTAPKARCGVVGQSMSCACTNGRTGAQICQTDGTLDACSCTVPLDEPVAGRGDSTPEVEAGSGGASGGHAGGEPGSDSMGGTAAGAAGCEGLSCDGSKGCRVGDVAGCSCADVVPGYRTCQDGMFSECTCPEQVQSAGGAASNDCIAETEWCDGHDNDCNGLTDDHFACRDDLVSSAFTRAFAGGVYFKGRSSDAGCDSAALQQFWPELSVDYLHGFRCYADRYRFRKSDGALFYSATSGGIVRDTPTTDVFQAASCGSGSPQASFDFTADDLLYFQCQSALVRGDPAELVADGVDELAGVFDDGRSLITRKLGPDSYVYSVVAVDGTELNRFPPAGFYTGSLETRPLSTTVVDNIAYTLLLRTYDQVKREILLYAIDEQSIFRLVRRRIVPSFGFTELALSDGTIFVYDAKLIRAYLPNNEDVVAYRASEGIFVAPDDSRFTATMLTGPRASEALP